METTTMSLRDSVALQLVCRSWGNRRQADMTKLESAVVADKDDVDDDGKVLDGKMLKVTKKLLVSDEYNACRSHIYQTKKWLNARSVPFTGHRGTMMFSKGYVETAEDYIISRDKELEVLVDNFVRVYRVKVEEAKDRLRGQFKEVDYPSDSYIRQSFRIEARWIAFNFPPELPRAAQEMEEVFNEARLALREGFKELIDKATLSLAYNEGEKVKRFSESTLTNIREFLDTFDIRNLTNDVEFEKTLNETREILTSLGDNTNFLRKDATMRDLVATGFSDVAKKLDTLVEEIPKRKLGF